MSAECGLSWAGTNYQVPVTKARQRHPPVDYRSPGATGPQGAGQEGQAQLHGTYPENRNGLPVKGCVTLAEGRAEPQAAVTIVEESPAQHRITKRADKGYESKDFVQGLTDHQVTPHIGSKQTSNPDAELPAER
jgi:hypothetical protein